MSIKKTRGDDELLMRLAGILNPFINYEKRRILFSAFC